LTAELIFYLLIVAWYRFRAARWPDVEYYALGWIAVGTVIRIGLLVTGRGPLPGPLAMPILLYYGQLFIVGLCLYRFYSGQGRPLTAWTLIAACGYSLFGGGPTSWAAAPWLYCLLTCGIATIVYLASRSRLALLELPVLTFLGDISYPLYLIHQVVGTQLMSEAHLHGIPPWLTLPAVVLILVAAAYLIHRLVEIPARAVLRAGLQQMLLGRTAATPSDPLQSSPTVVP
jgi:peptidoglycan/LPS O-acetylase OafA/YrhL